MSRFDEHVPVVVILVGVNADVDVLDVAVVSAVANAAAGVAGAIVDFCCWLLTKQDGLG